MQADATLLLRDLSFIAIANHPTLRFARSPDLPCAERFSQLCARTDLPFYSTRINGHMFFELCYYEAPIAEQKPDQTDDTPAEADDSAAHDPETANRLPLVEVKKERTEVRLCAIVYQLQGTYDPPGSFRCHTLPPPPSTSTHNSLHISNTPRETRKTRSQVRMHSLTCFNRWAVSHCSAPVSSYHLATAHSLYSSGMCCL